MSGRTVWYRDGQRVVGHRKTDRRQTPKRPLAERLAEITEKALRDGRSAGSAPAARMAFLLPNSLQGLVSNGQHGVGVTVLARGFVQIAGHSSEQCFTLARDFFQAVAKDRPAFTTVGVIMSSRDMGRYYSKHLTVVSGNLVVSGGLFVPIVYEARLP